MEVVPALETRCGGSLRRYGGDMTTRHTLVIPFEGPSGARCTCGADLRPLLPHYPRTVDAQKAHEAHVGAARALSVAEKGA